jgi:putative glutamine amidotransferase
LSESTRSTAHIRPLIGMTVGTTAGSQGRPSRVAGNRAYVNALQAAGAHVVLLPPGQLDALPALLDVLDGVLLPGGADIAPARYGEAPRPELQRVDEDLDAMEFALVQAAAEREVPVLGICRGLQVVNVALGGSLVQDIVADGLSGENHARHDERRDLLSHTIAVMPGTRLAAMAGACDMPVNSLHHQAVREVAPGLTVSARSADGLVEGLESADGRVVTIQCHPEELLVHEWARALFADLVRRAAERITTVR